MKKFFLSFENARRRQDLMLLQQRDRDNLNNTWRKFKKLVKAYLHHNILKCVPMEQFYTQQIADTVFVGGKC